MQKDKGPSIVILTSTNTATSDEALGKFAEFLGLQSEVVSMDQELVSGHKQYRLGDLAGHCIALSFPVLRMLAHRGVLQRYIAETKAVIVYGFDTAEKECIELKQLTGGIISGVTSVAGPREIRFNDGGTLGSFPVSGKKYTVESGSTNVFCAAKGRPGLETWIYANEQPTFLAVDCCGTRVFLLSDSALVDLDATLRPNSTLRPWYAQLTALAIFFRAHFNKWCWSNPVPRANFIVDDPYLCPRYGFLNYEHLLGELQQCGGALTVAFIPYNYRRSDALTTQLLRRHSGRFSIAVHGCDHTSREFASTNKQWLDAIAGCALDRMEEHSILTQMPFDDVMIFPQGLFSTSAIRALKGLPYTAAVNSTPWPVDGDPLTIRDLLDVAVTRYEKFPIFIRRYPVDIFDYAFDALFQKPVLVVEHHSYFRRGCEKLVTLIEKITEMEPMLEWTTLRTAVTSSCVMRPLDQDCYAVRFFTPVFRLRNPYGHTCTFMLVKPESVGRVEDLQVAGRRVPFEVTAGMLMCKTQLDAHEEVEVKVVGRLEPKLPYKPSFKYHGKVFARRMLSEVRDNYLSKSVWALTVAEKAKIFLKVG